MMRWAKNNLPLASLVFLLAGVLTAEQLFPKFEQALKLFQQKQWQQAADGFEAAEKASPGKTDALLYAGKSFINLTQLAQAASALQAYSGAHPQSAEALYLLAYVRFRQDNPRESLQLSTAAARLSRPTSDDLKVVALDYVLLNDSTRAIQYLSEALVLNPNNVEAHYALGRVLYQQNDFDRAIAAFQEVLRLDPGNEKAENNLGLALEGKNQTEAALAAYKQAIEWDKNSSRPDEQPYLNLGILFNKLNRSQEALPLLQRAAELDPKSAKARVELGRAYMNLQRLPEAQQELEAATRLQPDDSASHYLLGRLYQRMGKKELADKEFKLTEQLIRAKAGKMGTMGMEPK